MNPTEPVHQPLSVFFAVKDGKRSDFLKRYGSLFSKELPKNGHFFGPRPILKINRINFYIDFLNESFSFFRDVHFKKKHW